MIFFFHLQAGSGFHSRSCGCWCLCVRACVCIHDMHALCKKKINVYMNMKEAVMEKNGLAADIVIYWSALFLTHTHTLKDPYRKGERSGRKSKSLLEAIKPTTAVERVAKSSLYLCMQEPCQRRPPRMHACVYQHTQVQGAEGPHACRNVLQTLSPRVIKRQSGIRAC